MTTAESSVSVETEGANNEAAARRATRSPMERLDQLDRRIIAALQVNARATWRQIAAAVGSTESTVKRRAERLIETGAIRITAFTDNSAPGFPVLVQVTCGFSSPAEVARRLAERDDVRFVVLVTGPFDVVAEMIVPSSGRLAEIMMHELPTISGIAGTTTETVLRTFKRSYDWSCDLLGDGRAHIKPPPGTGDNLLSQVALDDVSLRIFQTLKEDGRCSYATLASRCGISESMARYRVENLLTRAGVRVVTIVDPHLLGYDAQLLLWLRVDLAQREQVATALAARREVRYLSATSGYSDLVCEVILRSQSEVYDFSSQVLGTLPGIHQVNMATELLTVKRAYLRMEAL